MGRLVQKRTLETRARLVAAAEQIVAQSGFDALRVEEVVLRAGVAKGTFFAHFSDKDALMALMIGARINAIMDEMEALPPPATVAGLVAHLLPLMQFMTCERYVFDVILRHSGAAALDEIGPIATTFERHNKITADWIAKGPFRRDVSAALLADGVQAFSIQSMALNFCALYSTIPLEERLTPYLEAWLLSPQIA